MPIVYIGPFLSYIDNAHRRHWANFCCIGSFDKCPMYDFGGKFYGYRNSGRFGTSFSVRDEIVRIFR